MKMIKDNYQNINQINTQNTLIQNSLGMIATTLTYGTVCKRSTTVKNS